MNDAQAAQLEPLARDNWYQDMAKQGYKRPARTWYADNSREPIRDETIRQGLIPLGAVIERSGLATTSSLPRYALGSDFAALFYADEADFPEAVASWRNEHLSREALARTHLIKQAVNISASTVLVTLPSGETRRLSPGPSSIIARAVVEEFAPRFLHRPALLWLSEPGNKVHLIDSALAQAIGLKINADRNLPDIILADLGVKPRPRVLLVFTEIVATDGPIHEQRKTALSEIAREAGFDPANTCFVTAFLDRASAAYRRVVAELAWGSFVWFAAEPDKLIVLEDHTGKKLTDYV